jgi:hypothetical protein
MNQLSIAFKEWAVICKALAEGRQLVLLRKGGIAEEGGVFRPEHERFWLYPTFFHEHANGVRPELAPLLKQAEAERPAAGTIRFTHFADVTEVAFVDKLDTLHKLAPFHGWTEAVIEQRFHYRSPGVYVLLVRVSKIPTPQDAPELPQYAGCKSWVELGTPLDCDEAKSVIADEVYAAAAARIHDAIRS